MPKKLFKVANFHGGLDETSSPVDMKNGYFTALTDVMVDRLGQIVPMGDFDVTATHNPTSTNFIVHSGNPGYGLFAFNSNRRLSGAFADCVIYVACKYISGDEGENFIFWDSVGDSWAVIGTGGDLASNALDLRSADLAGQMHPDFFAWDGVLRICDGNMANITDASLVAFGHDCNRGWVGYIKRTHFPNSAPGNSEDAYAGWYGYTSVQPVAPTKGYSGSVASGTGSGGDTTSLLLTNIGTNLENVFGDGSPDEGFIAMQDNGTAAAGHTIVYTGDGDLTTSTMADTSASQPFKIFPPTGTGCILDLTLGNTGGFLLE